MLKTTLVSVAILGLLLVDCFSLGFSFWWCWIFLTTQDEGALERAQQAQWWKKGWESLWPLWVTDLGCVWEKDYNTKADEGNLSILSHKIELCEDFFYHRFTWPRSLPKVSLPYSKQTNNPSHTNQTNKETQQHLPTTKFLYIQDLS